MAIKEPLAAPGSAGTYDPDTSFAGLEVPSSTFDGVFFEPVAENWRGLLAAYHEYAHHYQFHSTSFGYHYKLLSTAKILLANGILRVLADGNGLHKEVLPLGNAADLEVVWNVSGHPNELNRKVLAMLVGQLDASLGYGDYAPNSSLQDWRIAFEVLDLMFGLPRVLPLGPEYTVRYPVKYLLETHAHMLSAAWMIEAVHREGGDHSVAVAVANAANELAIGPYSGFLDFEPALAATEVARPRLFCALAEVALNPVGVHRHPGQDPKQIIAPWPTSWHPVARMETLMVEALDGKVTWSTDPWPESATKIADSITDSITDDSNKSAFFAGYDGSDAVGPLWAAIERLNDYSGNPDDVPQPLLMILLDSLGKCWTSAKIRQSHLPLFLTGATIDELRMLVSALGGPSSILWDEGQPSFTRVASCAGLMQLGAVEAADMPKVSDDIVTTGAPISHTLHLLTTTTKTEFEQLADQPIYGRNRWTPRLVLQDHYGVELSDFA